MPEAPPLDPLDDLRAALRAFVAERDWERFHTPKDLAVGLSVEAGELLQEFQWKDPAPADLKADAERFARVRDEVADTFLYALLLSERLGFDLVAAARAKLAANAAKYPADKVRGSALKYTELE